MLLPFVGGGNWLQEDKAATQKEVELQMEMAKWAAFGEE